jgi:hypothetical protein
MLERGVGEHGPQLQSGVPGQQLTRINRTRMIIDCDDLLLEATAIGEQVWPGVSITQWDFPSDRLLNGAPGLEGTILVLVLVEEAGTPIFCPALSFAGPDWGLFDERPGWPFQTSTPETKKKETVCRRRPLRLPAATWTSQKLRSALICWSRMPHGQPELLC